jgi:hypothetical protein
MSVQVKGSGTIGGIDEGLVVSGIVTATKVEAVGNSNGGKFGQLQIGYDPLNLTVQPISATDLHLNYNNGAYIKIGDQTTKTDIIINGDIHPKTDSARDLGTSSTRFRSIYADTLYGDGSNLTNILALSGSTNNTVCTVTGANAIQGESNLQFDGTTLTVSGYIESVGMSGRGAKLGNLSVGFAGLYNTVQTLAADTSLHLQYNVNGDIYTNEGGGDMITADIRPKTNGNFSLGTNSYRWANIHTNDLNLSNEGSANDIDGTWGQYTIQEGESDLFLINRRNGKRYKFNLTEID